MRDLIRREQERSGKIAAMQRLVDEARASAISDEGMAGIRARALRSGAGRKPSTVASYRLTRAASDDLVGGDLALTVVRQPTAPTRKS